MELTLCWLSLWNIKVYKKYQIYKNINQIRYTKLQLAFWLNFFKFSDFYDIYDLI